MIKISNASFTSLGACLVFHLHKIGYVPFLFYFLYFFPAAFKVPRCPLLEDTLTSLPKPALVRYSIFFQLCPQGENVHFWRLRLGIRQMPGTLYPQCP